MTRNFAFYGGIIWMGFNGLSAIYGIFTYGFALIPILGTVIFALPGFFAWRWAIRQQGMY